MSLIVEIEKELESFKLKSKFMQESGVLGFLGQSGSGKSMTLKCIAGLENPIKGKIILNNKILYDSNNNINLPPQKRNVGYLFQNYALFPHMNVMKNIEVGLEHLKKEERRDISKKYLKRLSLDGLENRYPWQLSGGQQQRVALARALAPSPELLLLDEPFSALDYNLRISMERELKEILKDFKGNVIFVTHDREEAYRICDDIVIYENGKNTNVRKKNELFNNPNSLVEAKITGCQNISPINIINERKIYCKDWGLEITLNKYIKKEYKHIGIRSNYIELKKQKDLNTYKLKVVEVIENPYTYTIYAKNNEKIEYKVIEIEICKDMYFDKNDKYIYVSFNCCKIFLF